MNNKYCFSVIFTCECQKVQNNELKLDKQHTKYNNISQLSGHALKCYIHRVAW